MSDELCVGGVESRKLKRKIGEPSSSTDDRDSEFLLSLSLGNKRMVGESSSGFLCKSLTNHNETPNFASKLMETTTHQVIVPMEYQFSCKFCNKKFPSPQALGGHQNAHRHERMFLRMEKDMRTFGHGAQMFPHSSIPHQFPFSGSLPLYYRNNMYPMTHMPTMSWPHFGLTKPWGIVAQTPPNLYSMDVAHRATMTHSSLSAFIGNQYTRN